MCHFLEEGKDSSTFQAQPDLISARPRHIRVRTRGREGGKRTESGKLACGDSGTAALQDAQSASYLDAFVTLKGM